MQDYNSLCAAVTICSTLINIHTQYTVVYTHSHRQTDSLLISLFDMLSQLS